jgi:hypothetical protein
LVNGLSPGLYSELRRLHSRAEIHGSPELVMARIGKKAKGTSDELCRALEPLM